MASKVPVVPGMRWRVVGGWADRLIQNSFPVCLQKARPFPIEKLFEFRMQDLLGFEPDVRRLSLGLEATMDPVEKTVTLTPATYNGLTNKGHRERFTVAHEIGHVVLHSEFLKVVLEDGRNVVKLHRSQIPPYKDPECQANAFAAALLMPTRHMIRFVSQRKPVEWIAERFNVSHEATELRIKNLEKYT